MSAETWRQDASCRDLDTDRVTVQQPVQMFKAALAEAGYPDAVVWRDEDEAGGYINLDPATVPRSVAWRAYAFVGAATGKPRACWPCWQGGGYRLIRGGYTHDTWDGAPPVVRPEVAS